MQTTCIYVGKQTCVMYRKKQEKNENHVRMKLHTPKHSQIKTNKCNKLMWKLSFHGIVYASALHFRLKNLRQWNFVVHHKEHSFLV